MRPWRMRWRLWGESVLRGRNVIRIVFVDNEVSVLQAVQLSLHAMSVPDMGGSQLLGQVKTLQPRMARLVLSNHADRSSIIRSIGVPIMP